MGWNPALHPLPIVSLVGCPRRQGRSFGSVVHTSTYNLIMHEHVTAKTDDVTLALRMGGSEPVEQFLTQDTPIRCFTTWRGIFPHTFRCCLLKWDNISGCMCQLNMISFPVCLKLSWHAPHHTHTQWPPIEHRQHTSPTFSRLINSLGQVFGTLEACWYEKVMNHFRKLM